MEPKQNMSINKKQNEILINFMSNHEDLARGILKTSQGRKTSNLLWEKLSVSLNTEGPPQKCSKDWKKTWSDIKYKVKNKLRKNKVHLKGTGGGPFMQKNIDELEEKIIQCAGLEAAVEGIPKAKSFGVKTNQFHNKTNDKEDDNDFQNNYAYEEIIFESPVVCEDSFQEIQNESGTEWNVPTQEPAVEHEVNMNNRRSKKEKESYMKQYVLATETIHTKLDAIHDILKSNQKTQKRRLEVEENIYKLKKKKLELYEKYNINRLRLKEATLNTKIEKNKILLQQLDSRKE